MEQIKKKKKNSRPQLYRIGKTNKEIIENKKTDKVYANQKKEDFNEMAQQFNSSGVDTTYPVFTLSLLGLKTTIFGKMFGSAEKFHAQYEQIKCNDRKEKAKFFFMMFFYRWCSIPQALEQLVGVSIRSLGIITEKCLAIIIHQVTPIENRFDSSSVHLSNTTICEQEDHKVLIVSQTSEFFPIASSSDCHSPNVSMSVPSPSTTHSPDSNGLFFRNPLVSKENSNTSGTKPANNPLDPENPADQSPVFLRSV
jgi:hypothetical protein